jgi:hypothetical protein
MVVVEAGGAIVEEESGGIMKSTPSANNAWQLTLFISIILIAGVSILFFNRTRLIPAMQTNNATIVTGNAPVSRKQTIDAVKNSVVTPSDDVFKSIMEKIEAKK